MPTPSTNTNASTALALLVTLAAFLSGTTGVLYETLYPHVLITLIGGTVYVVTATLITFLFAVAIGSVIARRLLPFLWLTELLLGVVALVIGWLFMFNVEALLPLGAYIPQAPVARIAVACLLVFPVAFLSGVSIPAFSLLLERTSRVGNEQLSLVYALYNIGAASAIVISEYVIVRYYGIGQALMLFGAADIVVALIAWLSLARTKPSTTVQPAPASGASRFWRSPVVWLIGLLGIVSGAFQMEMINITNLSFGPTSDVLAAVVALALTGIGVGSLFVRYTGMTLKTVALGMAVTLIGAVYAWPHILGSSLGTMYELHAFNGPGKLLFLAAVFGPFFVLTGASVPAASRSLWRNKPATGNEYGRLLMVAALGNVAGIIAFIALITAGATDDGLIVSMTLLLWMAALTLHLIDKEASLVSLQTRSAGVIALVIALVYASFPTITIALPTTALNSRIYQGASIHRIKDVDVFQKMNVRTAIYTLGGGERGKVNTARNYSYQGYTTLYYDTKDDYSAAGEMMITAVPAALTHTHRNSLIVGAASGISAGVSGRLFDNTWVLDLDPNTPEILHYFRDLNDHAGERENIHVVVQDAFSWLIGSDRKFDYIQIEPTSPATQNAGQLYTQEYLTVARNHLRTGGIVAAWSGSINGNKGQALLARTFAKTFDHVAVFQLSGDSYYVIMGSNDPIRPQHPETILSSMSQKQRGIARYLIGRSIQIPSLSDQNADDLFSVYVRGGLLEFNSLADKNDDHQRVPTVNTLNRPVLRHIGFALWDTWLPESDARWRSSGTWLSRNTHGYIP